MMLLGDFSFSPHPGASRGLSGDWFEEFVEATG